MPSFLPPFGPNPIITSGPVSGGQVIFLLSGNYIHALTRVITKRRLGDDANVLPDPDSIALLKNRLQDAHAGVVIYAMTILEEVDGQAIIGELPTLIRHPAPEVRREAFVRIEKLKLYTALNEVKKQSAVETIPEVKEFALRALGAITDEPSQLIEALSETDTRVQNGALIGLLKYGNEPSASQKLNDLLASCSIKDRNLAFEVFGEVKRRDMLPYLISACDSPRTSLAAGNALFSIGEEALPEIETALAEVNAPRQRMFSLAKILGRIGGPRSQTILLSQISTHDYELRFQILKALSQSGYRTKDQSMIQHAVKTEAEQAAFICAAQVDLIEMNEISLLSSALMQAFAKTRDCLLLLLSFVFDANSIMQVLDAVRTEHGKQLSYALETIEIQLPDEWKPMVMPLLEDLSPQERNQHFSRLFPHTKQKPEDCIQAIIHSESLSFWVRACAMYVFNGLNPNSQIGDKDMLSTVEKVLILKSVNIFDQTPDNVLAEVADLLEEIDVSENETIFKQGELGDSLYIILDGKVRVHDGERLLNYLGDSDIFGEMALLDLEPRLASITAVEATRLYRLDQESFYELIAERPEVATGIIHVLTRHLRDRVHDIAKLNTRIKELEDGRYANDRIIS